MAPRLYLTLPNCPILSTQSTSLRIDKRVNQGSSFVYHSLVIIHNSSFNELKVNLWIHIFLILLLLRQQKALVSL